MTLSVWRFMYALSEGPFCPYALFYCSVGREIMCKGVILLYMSFVFWVWALLLSLFREGVMSLPLGALSRKLAPLLSSFYYGPGWNWFPKEILGSGTSCPE